MFWTVALSLPEKVTLVSPLHQKNAEDPMLVTLDGIVTDVSLLQYPNAKLPMLVTLDGIVTDVSLLQSRNTYISMLVTAEPISTSIGYLIQDESLVVPLPGGISPAATNTGQFMAPSIR